jgi:formylmethanofuran dehydrogenase subunit B
LIERIEPSCPLAEPFFLQQNRQHAPVAMIDGRSVPLEAAIERAAELLQQAQSPLVYGLSRSSTAGQRLAVRLAEQLGASIDTTASVCHAPSIMAIQEVGESTCSLGEIKNRSDLVVFWGVNPLRSHPRHLERYSGEAAGMFLPAGRRDRTLIVVDIEAHETALVADHFIQVDPDRDFEMIWALRCLLRGDRPQEPIACGVPLARLEWLIERFKAARSGVILFGLGLARTGAGHRNVEAVLRLVTDLNAHTRFYARRMRIPGDVTGADMVLCWLTGFPFSVNLSRGYPRYNPGEYSANELLERGEVDACLLVGSESVSSFSQAAQARLAQLPTITLDYPAVGPSFKPHVRFTTAVYGVHRSGTAYRMDEVPLPLRKILPSTYPSDDEVLQTILDRLKRQ